VTDNSNQSQKISDQHWPSFSDTENKNSTIPDDHYVTRDGVEYAGIHLLVDFWQASHLNDLIIVEQALRDSVKAANATLLHIHLHHFAWLFL